MVPHEIDHSTLCNDLSIEQRGGNPDHFEVVPSGGGFPPIDVFQAWLNQIGILP
jgi:hypothetical protein